MKKNEEKIKLEDLDVSEEIRKNIEDFNSFIHNIKKSNGKIEFNIILDNMSRNDIDVYLEFITQTLIDEHIVNEIVEYHHQFNYKVNKNNVVIVDIDELPSFAIRYEEDLCNFLNSHKSSLLIFYTSQDINNYDSFKDINITNTLPIYRISHKHSSDLEYDLLLNKYKDKNYTCDISKNYFNKIYDSIKDNSYAKSFGISDYLYNYSIVNNCKNGQRTINSESFSSIITDNKKETKKVDFNSLTGLSNIKEEINKLLNYASFKKNINSKEGTYLNLFFLGNPGTGKTMVANIISTKLYEMGYLKYDEVIKIVPNDLIGEYVGHTRRKTRDILDDAEGKLLLIDEAYLLYNPNYSKGNNPFMEEAIVELLKYLEDPKNIVIFAGYTNEMRKLYDVNPGLKSRIYKEIEFNDYTNNELYKILSNDLKKQGLLIDKNIKKDVLNYINYLKGDKDFGNARTILKLSQELVMNHANSNSSSLIINKEDIPKYIKNNNSRMGFDA